MKNILPAILVSLMITLLCAALAGCQHKAALPEEAKPLIVGDAITFPAASPALKNIVTEKVAAPLDRELNIPGRLVWDEDRTVRVFTPFAGRVSKIVANVGDKVVKGQVLAELQSPDFAAAQTDARKAQSMLKLGKQALGRVKELAANGVAAGKDLQQAEADYANAEAEANRATARLKLYGDSQNIDQRFNLVSSIAGTVVERNLNPGQELRPDQPNAPQFVVTDPARLWVQLDATEIDLRLLTIGAPISITTNQYPDDSFAGELKQIADFIDPLSRSLKLRGVVPNPERRLKAEMFINARIALTKNEFPTVSEKAVFLDGMQRFVFVKTGPETFVRRGVKVALDSINMVAAQNGLKVLGGLHEGEEVVVSGNLLMQQMVAAARMDEAVLSKTVKGAPAITGTDEVQAGKTSAAIKPASNPRSAATVLPSLKPMLFNLARVKL